MRTEVIMTILVISSALVLAQTPSTTCPAKCNDCQTDLGVTSCYACYNSTFNTQDFTTCGGDSLPNCLIANRQGQCVQCLKGFALSSTDGTCGVGAIKNCILEYVDQTSTKCAVCDGSFPSDDLTKCGTTPFADDDVCVWGTVLGNCIKCRYDNLMAGNAGQCVGKYLYGCLQENGVSRCNGCDHESGFYMKFGSMCWKD